MKTLPWLLGASLVANLALAVMFLARATSASSTLADSESRRGNPPASAEPASAAAVPADANLALRDRLRALGFSEDEVRAALRARIEAPRLARQRELQRASAALPWWRVALPVLDPTQSSRELRELRKAERAELVRMFGPGGDVPREEAERYAFRPGDKAARFAALERDYRELRREVPAGPGAPQSREEAAEREKLIKAAYERDVAALLTPGERTDVERRTSITGYIIAERAKYFPGTEEEFARLFDLTKAHREASGMDALPTPGRGASGIDSFKKYTDDTIALLGPERYRQWDQAMHHDYRALVALQRRFTVPPATIAALAALPRQVGEEGMVIARDQAQKEEVRVAAVHALAARTRETIRTLLGPDLGEAYSEAANRGWLEQLDRGIVPYVQENGQRAGFMVSRQSMNSNAPPPRPSPPPRQ
jgi:hypothetical protein